MNRTRRITVALAATALLLAMSPALASALTAAEATELGTEAYVFGYPLVTMEMTRRVMTNVAQPGRRRAPRWAS